ncbi:hypothetical protein FNYG_13886 [Fusarium nygamai]|uniref:Ubiquitin-like domain-containing protein n=1 Tax=Gibberella nygamai TaxID=42673 RepID=A0A2K0UUE3_GIBNY|nr:hypothetical protein FNYG_13886 [Fusarium nygamai]
MAHNEIEPVAKLGLSLASSLQVHSEANRRARQRLPKLISLVNSTALTLIKVDDVIQENALTKLCFEDITRLSATCEKIYIGILIMLVRQTENFVGDKELNEIPREETGKYLQCIAQTGVLSYESWKQLEVQLRYFRHWLTQIKFELMLRYLLGSIAQHQMRAQTRVPGNFETENTIRQLADHLAYKRASHYKFWSKNTPTIAVDTKVEEIKPVETIPAAETQSPELSKDTEVLADTTAETTSTPTQLDQQPAKEPGPNLLSAARDWIKRNLMPGSHDEWKDQDLEVWQIDLAAHFNSIPIKTFKRLELDDKHVRSALSQATSKTRWKKRPGLLEQYDSLDQRVRQRIDDCIDATNQWSSRERTWIAMSISRPPLKSRSGAVVDTDGSICLFFRLGDAVEPIHVVELHTGKKLTFPFASCKNLDSLRKRLSSLSLGYPATAILKEGKYNFCAEDGTIILPEAWESLRCPGMTLNIQNFGTPIPPVFGGQRPFHAPGGIRPNMTRPTNVVTIGRPSTGTTTSDSSSSRSCTSLTMKEVHRDMEEMLQLSDSWSPDPDTMGTGVGRLLGLWTNAPDHHVNVIEDSDSEWSCSTEDSDCSSRDICD